LSERAGTPFIVPNEGTATECDLVVTGVVDGEAMRWLRRSNGSFESENGSISESELLALAEVPDQPMTFTCAPPGSGPRMAGLDGAGGSGGSAGAGGASGAGGSDGDGGSSTEGSSGGCGCVVGASPREQLSGVALAALTLLGLAAMRHRR